GRIGGGIGGGLGSGVGDGGDGLGRRLGRGFGPVVVVLVERDEVEAVVACDEAEAVLGGDLAELVVDLALGGALLAVDLDVEAVANAALEDLVHGGLEPGM